MTSRRIRTYWQMLTTMQVAAWQAVTAPGPIAVPPIRNVVVTGGTQCRYMTHLSQHDQWSRRSCAQV